MLAFPEAVLFLAFMTGLPSTFSTEIGKGKLPEQFLGIFRNDQEKENHRKALTSVIELPRSAVEAEGNFIHFLQINNPTTYVYCPLNTALGREITFETITPCIPFKLGERIQADNNGNQIEVMFHLTDDPTVLKGSITNAQQQILQIKFTFSERGVEFLSIYRNHSQPETITTKAFYQRTLQRHVLGMFEMDTERVTQETIDKANSIFLPLTYGASFTYSADTRLWVREPHEGVILYVTLFSAAYQWSKSLALFENETFYYNLFNSTTEARDILEKSTPAESVLLSRMKSSDGRFNLNTRTVFEVDAVKEILTFNGEQVTLYYRRIVEDLLYGTYEEVSEPGLEGLGSYLKMPCPGTESRSRLQIGRSAARQYSLDITPCEDTDPVHIPFMLKNETMFTPTQQNNRTATAYFYIDELGALQAELSYNFHRRRTGGFSLWITARAAKDPLGTLTGISLNIVESSPLLVQSYKFRRLFPNHMFGSFDSTNDTSNITKSVLQFSHHDNGSFVGKLSVGHKKPITTKFVGTTWTDDTGQSGAYFYFEFAGDGVPAILRILWEDEYPYRVVWGETMIFKPDGVEVHTSITAENQHTKRFYSRKPSVDN